MGMGMGRGWQHESGQVLVDGWIPLQSAAQTAVLFKELRGALDALLTKKIRQPQLDLVSDGVVPTIVQLLLDEDATQQQA
jgi:ATP-dependent RNA helicase DHX29